MLAIGENMSSIKQVLYNAIWKMDEQPKKNSYVASGNFGGTPNLDGLDLKTLRQIALMEPLVLKAIRKKTRDTFRQWLIIKSLDENKEVPKKILNLIADFDRRTLFKEKLHDSALSSYIYGTGFIERTFVNNNNISSPLDKREEPLNFNVIDSENISKKDTNPKTKDSTLYWIYKKRGGEDKYLHPDRIIDVSINKLPFSPFGISVINTLNKILTSKLNIDEASGQILTWFGHGILSMKINGMNVEQQKKMEENFAKHPDYYVYDEDYELDVKNPTRIDPKPFYDYLYVNIAAALEMPTHILTGQELGDVTGSEVGVMDYYHDIENIQKLTFTPIVEKIYRNLLESHGYKWNYSIIWNPLYADELSEAKTLQIRSYSATESKNSGIISIEEARKMLNDGMIKLNPSEIPKQEEKEEPIIDKPNIAPQPVVKERKMTITPLTEIQREMIQKEKLRGEIEIIEQEKRIKAAKKK